MNHASMYAAWEKISTN